MINTLLWRGGGGGVSSSRVRRHAAHITILSPPTTFPLPLCHYSVSRPMMTDQGANESGEHNGLTMLTTV